MDTVEMRQCKVLFTIFDYAELEYDGGFQKYSTFEQ